MGRGGSSDPPSPSLPLDPANISPRAAFDRTAPRNLDNLPFRFQSRAGGGGGAGDQRQPTGLVHAVTFLGSRPVESRHGLESVSPNQISDARRPCSISRARFVSEEYWLEVRSGVSKMRDSILHRGLVFCCGSHERQHSRVVLSRRRKPCESHPRALVALVTDY